MSYFSLRRSFLRFRSRSGFRSRLRFFLTLDRHPILRQPGPSPRYQLEGVRGPLIRRHLGDPMRYGPGDVNLLALAPLLRLPARQPGQRRIGVGRVVLDIFRPDHAGIRRVEDLLRAVLASQGPKVKAIRHFRVRKRAPARDG